jgi:glycosyltransferase involved in cell wall biosynthesis
MDVSIVVPVYNEAPLIAEFHQRLRSVIDALPYSFEVWYVNDGSRDRTEAVVIEIIRQDSCVRLLNLSRNFGHQAALTAGLDFAEGQVIITMDGDGQHLPEYIKDMLDLYERGFDVVLTQRISDRKEGYLKRSTSWSFYRLINLVSSTAVVPGAADFRLMSREVVLSFRQIREAHRFLRGLIAWMGFRWITIEIKPSPRIAGKSKYSFRKMMRLAYEAIFSFSTVPIRLSILLGIFVLGLAFLQFLDPLILILSGKAHEIVPGWTTMIISVLILGATQLITLAIVGQYVGLIYEEVKRRPLYLLRGRPLDQTTLDEWGSR